MNVVVGAAGSGNVPSPSRPNGGNEAGPVCPGAAAAATKCGKVAHATATAPSTAGHVSFIAVPDDCRAQRAKERRQWREPLYDLPVGASHHSACLSAAALLVRGRGPVLEGAPCRRAVRAARAAARVLVPAQLRRRELRRPRQRRQVRARGLWISLQSLRVGPDAAAPAEEGLQRGACPHNPPIPRLDHHRHLARGAL